MFRVTVLVYCRRLISHAPTHSSSITDQSIEEVEEEEEEEKVEEEEEEEEEEGRLDPLAAWPLLPEAILRSLRWWRQIPPRSGNRIHNLPRLLWLRLVLSVCAQPELEVPFSLFSVASKSYIA